MSHAGNIIQPGTQVGSYGVLSFLGEGGFASVYRARHQVLARDVALKVLHDRTDSARFLREAQILARLAHPNIVEVDDVGVTDDGRAYLALELVEGQPLSSILRRGALTPGQSVWVLDQVLGALDASHRANVVHRDVKPGNVLVGNGDGPGRVKLIDFGVCRPEDAVRLTQTGALVGTLPYFAPELLNGASASASTDVFSAGIVLLECLTGRPAYEAAGMQLIPFILAGRRRPVPDHVPESLRRVVERALASVGRYGSAAEMRHELVAAVPGEPMPMLHDAPVAPAVDVVRSPVAPANRAPWAMFGLGVLATALVAAAGIGVFAVTRSGEDPRPAAVATRQPLATTPNAPVPAPVAIAPPMMPVVPVADAAPADPVAVQPEEAAPSSTAEPPERSATRQRPRYRRGQGVEVLSGGRWHGSHIERVNPDGTYDIRIVGGSYEQGVPRDRVRRPRAFESGRQSSDSSRTTDERTSTTTGERPRQGNGLTATQNRGICQGRCRERPCNDIQCIEERSRCERACSAQ